MSDATCREANVLLEFRMGDSLAAHGLDAAAEAAIAAVSERASDIALGPAVAANTQTRTIKLRFDVLAKDGAAVHEQISKVAAVILNGTNLVLSEQCRGAAQSRRLHSRVRGGLNREIGRPRRET
jgi:hypothetical protein